MLALVAGACSGDDDPSDGAAATSTTETSVAETTTTAEPTTTTEDPAAAVEQAFFDQWDAYLEIVRNPDPSHPLIEQTYTGGARDEVLNGVSKLISEGRAIRRPDDPQLFIPRVLDIRELSETEFVLFECTIQGLVLFDQETGDVVDDELADYNRKSRYVLEDGRWKVAQTTRFEEGDPTCDDI